MFRCARVHFSKYNIEFSYVDMTDLSAVEKAIKPNTVMIFSETPTNPTLQLADVKGISDIAAKHGKILHVCDSTFATPIIIKPLNLGADIVYVLLLLLEPLYYYYWNPIYRSCVGALRH